ncbi:MAG: hypothetical protein II752_04270 [Muribaculaceae bacterium]|nr:hypothetical protein [Muribaculaceae bacterium]
MSFLFRREANSSLLIGSSADGFATAGCLSGNTRFGISPSHFVGSSFIIHYEL